MNWIKGQHVDNGRYEIVDRIGTGEFGSIYRAIDLKNRAFALGKDSAIAKYRRGSSDKIKSNLGEVTIETIDENHQYQTSFDRFQDFFKKDSIAIDKRGYFLTRARVFSEDKVWGIETRNFEDETLEHYINSKGVLTESQAIEIIRVIGGTISCCYNPQFLFRDINTANITINPNGEPTLTDVGLRGLMASIASDLTIEKDRTSSLQLNWCGERQYIYALASTLYTCVTGDKPPSIEMRIKRDTLRDPQQLNPQISDRINQIILTGMALKIEDRAIALKDWLNLMPPSNLDEIAIVMAYRRGRRFFYNVNCNDLKLLKSNLHNLVLFNANCTRTNFKKSDLTAGEFDRVDFSHAILRNTLLSRSLFSRTNLQNANLRGADLSDTEFDNTTLKDANLCGANLKGAKISEEDLRQAKTNFLTIFPNGKRGGWW